MIDGKHNFTNFYYISCICALYICVWKLLHFIKETRKVLGFVLSPRLSTTFRLASALSWVATPLAKRRPFDHFQDKWQNLRMQYPAWRKKPLLCRMQFRVTAERARAFLSYKRVCVCISCPFTSCRSENSSGRSLVWIFICRSKSCSNLSDSTRVIVVPFQAHYSIRWLVFSKYGCEIGNVLKFLEFQMSKDLIS